MIDDLRARIDVIDGQIVALLNTRAGSYATCGLGAGRGPGGDLSGALSAETAER